MPKLSILIPTIAKHKAMFDKLVEMLLKQSAQYSCEILYDESPACVGAKRQHLLESAKGDYVVYFDSDDEPSDNYISSIFSALTSLPDVVSICGIITTNGGNSRDWKISKDYGSWYERNNVYYRTPNHLCPVRRELALKAGFPNITFGEDKAYSDRLLPLIKTEVIIPHSIYHYKYLTLKK